MKHLLLSALLANFAFVAPAQTAHPRTQTAHHKSTHTASRPAAVPSVYVCGGSSAHAYHRSSSCAGLSRCSHDVSAVSVNEAQQAGRHPCKKCY